MQNLTPSEIEALTKALGTKHPHTSTHEHTDTHAISRAHFSQLHEQAGMAGAVNLQEVTVQLEVVLGRTKKSIKELMKIQEGSVLALNTLAGEPVELLANNKLIAKGEVVIVDGNYGIRILETT